MRIVLASASPRRRELLRAAGFDFAVHAQEVDERRHAGEAPAAYTQRIARDKAESGARRHTDALVLGADTIVVVDGDVLGKPADEADARHMLQRLSGRSHDVLTGVAVAWQGKTRSAVERTVVWMARLSVADINWYVASGETADKAGAYAIQGLASRFVTRIEGSYSNVVGLPVSTVVALLEKTTPGVVFGIM